MAVHAPTKWSLDPASDVIAESPHPSRPKFSQGFRATSAVGGPLPLKVPLDPPRGIRESLRAPSSAYSDPENGGHKQSSRVAVPQPRSLLRVPASEEPGIQIFGFWRAQR